MNAEQRLDRIERALRILIGDDGKLDWSKCRDELNREPCVICDASGEEWVQWAQHSRRYWFCAAHWRRFCAPGIHFDDHGHLVLAL